MYKWHAPFMQHMKQVASMHPVSGFKTLAAFVSVHFYLDNKLTPLSLGLFELENPPIK